MLAHVEKARRRAAETAIWRALRTYEPRVAAAFAAAVANVKDKVSLAAIARALEAGDMVKATELAGAAAIGERLAGVGLLPGQRSARDELIDAFRAGGDAGLHQLPRKAGIAASLDLTNPSAVQFLRDHVPTLIREVDDEARLAVQQAVLRGMEEGRPIPAIAREVRESVGLTRAQQRFVANFRRQMETGQAAGKDPGTRRLSAPDRQQARSIFADGGEKSARVNSLVDRYSSSLVNRRANDIARTETHRAFVSGQEELWSQAADKGLIDRQVTRRVWIVTPDDRLREDHRAVPGMNPEGVGLDEPFQTPVGPVMNPGESGDPAFDINCRCTVALEFTDAWALRS